MSEVKIRSVIYTEATEPIQMIRRAVFQDEQGVTPELEFDGLDGNAVQLLAYLDDRPVGTARITQIDRQTAKIERLAVLPDARGYGIGSQLMRTALAIISGNENNRKVVVNAQEYIQNLYRKIGFQTVGEPFDEAGIPHVKMIKYLEDKEIE